jgi:hypothetical protein
MHRGGLADPLKGWAIAYRRCGVGSALPPLEKGRVGVGIILLKAVDFDPHPPGHRASKTRVNALSARRPPLFKGR